MSDAPAKIRLDIVALRLHREPSYLEALIRKYRVPASRSGSLVFVDPDALRDAVRRDRGTK